MTIHVIMFFLRVARNRRGVSAMEYAVLAVGIISAVAVGAAVLAHGISGIYTTVASEFAAATGI